VDNPFRFKLLEEVQLQCRFAGHAFSNVTGSLQLNDGERVFFYVHAFVRHAVDVGKLLWPGEQALEERGKALREACGAGEAPTDFTAFRELVDSFDDKLIAWYGNEAHRDAQPMNLMPVGTLGGFPADDFHRSLDPDTLQFTFEGVSGNLRQMNDVLRKIDADAEKWLRKNNPW